MDISGRHEEPGGYDMVCAAVEALVSPDNLLEVKEVEIHRGQGEPTLNTVVELVQETVERMSGVVVSEEGEFYEEPGWRVEAILGRPFKYVETIGERGAIEVAHYTALAARRAFRREHKR